MRFTIEPQDRTYTVGDPEITGTFYRVIGGNTGEDVDVSYNPGLPPGITRGGFNRNRSGTLRGSPTTPGVYPITLTLSGGGAPNTLMREFTITVNAGEPTVTASGTYEVAEDATPDTEVGAALTTSGFSGDGGTWSITAGNTGTAFKITSGGQIQVAAALDHETTSSYDLTVQFAQGEETATADVTVTVTNVNERPVANAGPDQRVTSGDTVTLTGSGTDPDAGDSIAFYSWSAPPGIFFAGSNSNAFVGQTATFTAPDVSASTTYDISLAVRDSNNLWSPADSVTVTVDPLVNNPPPAPTLANQSATAGIAFTYQFAAVTDSDGNTVTYAAKLSDDSALPGWLDFTAATRTFSGTPGTGDGGTITVRVTATDDGSPAMSSDAEFDIAVAVPTVTSSGTYEIAEDAGIDADVGAALTASGFPGSGGTWSIEGGNTGDAFKISNAGQIQVAAPLDHETTSNYTLTVRFAQGGVTATTTVMVAVIDVDESAVSVAINAGIASDDVVNIAERGAGFVVTGTTESGAAVNVTVGSGSARTATVNGIAWTVAIPANASEISGTSVTVTATATLAGTERATGTATRTLTVDLIAPIASWTAPASLMVGTAIAAISPAGASTDTAGYAVQSGALPPGLTLDGTTGAITGTPTAANSAEALVTIRLTDQNGNPGDVSITFPAVGRGEQSLSGFAYTPATVRLDQTPTLTAPTVSPSPGGALSYSATPSIVCTVASATGTLTLVGVGTCTVTATAAQTANRNVATATATVTVTAAPSLIGMTTINVPENTASGDDIGSPLTPVDFPPGTEVWSIEAGNDAGVFAIDSSTGQLSLAQAVDFETSPNSYTLTVQLTRGDGTATAEVTVTVVDVDELAVNVTIAANIAGDDVINIAEKMAGFSIAGTTEEGASVSVTLGSGGARNATVTGTGWTVDIPPDAAGISGTSITVTATATLSDRTAGTASRPLTVDLVAPTASWTVPASLTVGVPIAEIAPSNPSEDAAGYAVESGTPPPGLTLNAGTGTITGTPTTANSNAAPVTIRLTDGAGNPGDVPVTFPAVGRGAQTLTGFAYTPATVRLNEPAPALTAPTVSPGPGGTLSYSAAPATVCTVDPGTGTLTLVGVGTCTVTATAAQTADRNAATATTTVTVVLDATVGFASASEAVSGDEGTPITFDVVLSETPGAVVTVDWAASRGSGDTAEANDFTAASGMLTFAADASGDDLTQTVTVPTAGDGRVETNETFTVTLSGLSGPDGVILGTATATGTITNDDSAMVSITGSGEAMEGGQVAFTVELSATVEDSAVTVLLDTSLGSDDTAEAEDFTAVTNRTVTFAAGAEGSALTQTVNVDTIDDALAEGDETFTVTIVAGGGGFPDDVSLGNPTATGTIRDDEMVAMVSIGDASGTEGGNVSFEVTLSGSPGADVVVAYATSVETADTAAATDFTDTSGTLTFAAGATGTGLTQTIDVAADDDVLAEGAETFTMTISAGGSSGLFPGGVTLGTSTATGTIAANDEAMVSIAAPSASVSESGELSFTVELSGSPGADVVVAWNAVPGSAEADDFATNDSSPLTFTMGATGAALTRTITFTATDDMLAEGAETFTVTISEDDFPPGVTLGTSTATGTILANDPAMVSIAPAGGLEEDGNIEFTVTLSGGTLAADTTVGWTASVGSGTATTADFAAGSDTVTFPLDSAAGATQTFQVTVTDDMLAEGAETFTVTISEDDFPPGVTLGTSTATGTIEASDMATVSISGGDTAEEGDMLTFMVSITNPPAADVVVTYATSIETGDTAAATDFADTNGTLTFAAGTNDLERTVTVDAFEDNLAEGPESFTMEIREGGGGFPTNVELGARIAKGTIGTSNEATVSISGGSAAEGGAVTFTVTLSGSPGADVTVAYSTAPGSAIQEDFTAADNTLTFMAGVMGAALTRTVSVPVTDDDLAEGSESFTMTISAGGTGLPGGVTLGALTTATGTILASDRATFSIADAGGSEDGGSIEFTVTLSGGTLTGPATVNWAAMVGSGANPAAATDFTVGSGMVMFADGSVAGATQTFTVVVTDDMLAEGPETFAVEISENDFPPNADLGTATATGTIAAGDAATVSITPAAASGSEGDRIEFTVVLSNSPGAEVRLDWAPVTASASGDTAQQDVDFEAMTGGGTLVFETGATGTALTRTIAVQTIEDMLAEGDETFTVVVTEASGSPLPPGVTLASSPTLTARGTIEDDDMATVSIADARGSEMPGGGNIEFTVTLSGSPGSNVMVAYATSVESGDSALQADFTDTSGTLTFMAGATGTGLTQTFDVPVTDDMLAEGEESFTATLSIISGPSAVILDPDGTTAMGTIEASDEAMVSIADAEGAEGGNVAFTVTLSGSPGADVVVMYTAAEGSASPADFTAVTPSPLTFAAGATGADLRQTIIVEALDDMLAEGPETFTVTIGAGSGGFPASVSLGQGTATGTILDTDSATVSIGSADGAEGGEIVFTVTLSGSPGSDVVVTWAASLESGDTASQDDFTDFTAASGELIFTAGTTALSQDISVSTVSDSVAEGDETFTVTIGEGGGGFPQNVNPGETTATGTIRDDVEASAASRQGRVDEAVLPHVVQAMAAGALSAITGRIESAAGGSFSGLDGKANLLQALKASERGLEDGTMDLERILGRSSFVMPLNASGHEVSPGTGAVGDVAVWGSGDWRRLSGPDDEAVEWDGDMFSFHLGADVRVRRDLLAGVSVSRSSGSFDYMDRSDEAVGGRAVGGRYDSRMTGVHPYASWSPVAGSSLWATVGWGRGEIEIEEEGLPRRSSDTEMRSATAGARHSLVSDDSLVPGGMATLRLKGEGSLARIEVKGRGPIRPVEFDVRRLRLALEGGWECLPGTAGGCVEPSLEVGVRHDGGDARTGAGVEIGGGLRWRNRGSGLTLELRGRSLVAEGDGYEDWGVGGLIRLDPGTAGRGLSLRLAPGFGEATAAADRLYEEGTFGAAEDGEAPSGRLDAEIGYGFAVAVAGDGGVLTPYAGLSLTEGRSRNWRLGGRFALGSSFRLSLEGTRRDSGTAATGHGVMLRGRLNW